jgi:uncharacterized protein YcnI
MSITHSLSRRLRHFAVGSAVVVAGIVGAAASTASAHVSIVTYGTTFTAGATNVIYFRVPHSCAATEATTKVTVTIPSTVTGVKPQHVPGWTLSRVLSGTTTTSVSWTSTGADYDLLDWQFMDFGIRATLNGVDGDIIAFDSVTQDCTRDDAGAALGAPTAEVWTGADAPKLTLVGTTKKIANAADLADAKNRLVTAEATVATHTTAVDGIVTRLAAFDAKMAVIDAKLASIEAQLAIANVTSSVSVGAGRLSYVVDLSSVWRYKTFDITVAGVKVGSIKLDKAGDAAGALTKAASAGISVGAVIDFDWNGFTLTSATVG